MKTYLRTFSELLLLAVILGKHLECSHPCHVVSQVRALALERYTSGVYCLHTYLHHSSPASCDGLRYLSRHPCRLLRHYLLS